jgi:hypothetical protein
MIAMALLLARMLCDWFKSRARLEAEIVVLRHQLNVLRLRAPRRLYLRWTDRVLFVWLYRCFPRILDAITIVRPETVDQLFGLLVLGHSRRRLIWFAATAHPTTEWLARQITEAFPWDGAPNYLIRDNDKGIRQRIQGPHPSDGHPGSAHLVPRALAEWMCGTLDRVGTWRECTDHLIVVNEEHLRRILAKFAAYYNHARTHNSLGKDAPYTRPIERFGHVIAHPILGGLNHRYARI